MYEKILQYQSGQDESVGKSLLQDYAPLIDQHIKKWSGVLPDIVLRKHAESYALDAFKTYDPSRGAHIGTHLYNNLQRLSRLNYANQNIARIPEHHIRNISKVKDAESILGDQLGREASNEEVAKHLKMPVAHVKQLKSITRPEFSIEGRDESFQTESVSGPDQNLVMKINDTVARLSPEDKRRFSELTGFNGVKQLKPHEFGAKYNMKPYEVSRYKNSLAKVIEKGLL